MNEEVIYPSMVIRSQAEAIELLEKENKELKEELVSANESITWWNNRFNALTRDNKQLKEEKRKVRDYINKHCVNEKISKEVGYKCYTMADTNELEKIMKILEDKEVE